MILRSVYKLSFVSDDIQCLFTFPFVYLLCIYISAKFIYISCLFIYIYALFIYILICLFTFSCVYLLFIYILVCLFTFSLYLFTP